MKIYRLSNNERNQPWVVAASGPDSASTWAECWGSTATAAARILAGGDSPEAAISAAAGIIAYRPSLYRRVGLRGYALAPRIQARIEAAAIVAAEAR